MSDVVDRAQEVEAQLREDALAEQAVRGRALRGDWERISAKWCEGFACGERIPDERRRAIPGVRMCVECQRRIEEEQRRVK